MNLIKFHNIFKRIPPPLNLPLEQNRPLALPWPLAFGLWPYFGLWPLAFGLMVSSCAQQGSLSGGEKDTEPPKILESTPPNFSTNFSGKTIEIKFDEYFELRNVRQKLVVSPPMKEKPEFKIKGKTLEIKLIDSLQPNRTYAINFGDALVDMHEANPLENFQFVFSTGNEIDSLMMSGTVLQISDQKPGEEVVVMLYADLQDSIPITDLPLYLAKTNKEGKFTLRNLAEGSYKLFALKDGNNNFRFDKFDEPIAFSDTLVSPRLVWDITREATDSTPEVKNHRFEPLNLTLNLFTEEHPRIYLSSGERPRKDLLRLNFSLPIDTLGINILTDSVTRHSSLVTDHSSLVTDHSSLVTDHSSLVTEYWASPDTIDLWIPDTTFARRDTIRLSVSYNALDSLEQRTILTDTVRLIKKTVPAAPARGAKGAGPEFALQSSVNSSKMHDLGKPLRISSTLPVAEIDTSRIHLTMGKDSLATPVTFTLIQDTLRYPISSNIYPESSILHPKYPNHPRSYLIRCALVPDSSYTLFVEPGAFKSYWGAVNDTLLNPFKMKGLDKYGSIKIYP